MGTSWWQECVRASSFPRDFGCWLAWYGATSSIFTSSRTRLASISNSNSRTLINWTTVYFGPLREIVLNCIDGPMLTTIDGPVLSQPSTARRSHNFILTYQNPTRCKESDPSCPQLRRRNLNPTIEQCLLECQMLNPQYIVVRSMHQSRL